MKAFSVSTQRVISFPGTPLTPRDLLEHLEEEGVEVITKPGVPSIPGWEAVACDPQLIVSDDDFQIVKRWLEDHDYLEQT